MGDAHPAILEMGPSIGGDDADVFLETALHNWDFFVRAWYFQGEQAHHHSTATS